MFVGKFVLNSLIRTAVMEVERDGMVRKASLSHSRIMTLFNGKTNFNYGSEPWHTANAKHGSRTSS